ncbi:MAG TPA: branched-chain amino acid transaminase [Candidatus Latescibacteria bacterium]|nr:branched-chain amino acid transaminase [Candidatus Latescibacterota bacterium]
MAFPKAEKIWFNGKLVDWEDAKIHVLSHVVHYGSSIFEGLRCYDTKRGPACFRLRDHIDRLFDSCKIYRMEIPYSKEEIFGATLETIKANNLRGCYVRPIVFRGYGSLGVDPTTCPVDVAIAVWRWGKYLGADSDQKGIAVRISSWNRMAPNTLPSLAKVGANYMNSQLIKLEAMADGYAEGIGLDIYGYVSEGSGENIFLVKRGVLYTPPLSASILPGITRRSVVTLADDLGIEVREEPVVREALYIADEVFLTGSAAEIVPIRSIDRIEIGEGKRGPITERLQREFLAIAYGEKEDRHGWLDFVYQ